MSNYSIHVNSILLLIPIPVCIDISIVSGITVISSYMYNYIYNDYHCYYYPYNIVTYEFIYTLY